MCAGELPDRYRSSIDAGHRALNAAEWQAARTAFQAALDVAETPEALEGLGLAAWWLDDVPVVFQSRARAFALYREHDDPRGAARLASWIGLDYYIYRGALAIANGWLQRGTRLLEHVPSPSFEHGFMTFVRGYIAMEQHELDVARVASRDGLAIARSLGLIDLEMLSLALYGLVRVSEGAIDEGMTLLDESVAAALGGELTDPDAIVTCCCYLFYACERVRDYERAAQWCEKIRELCERWAYRSMFAVCRTHYAGILLWRGAWSEAESELTEATNELMAGRAGWAGEGLIRLAELRRRQGRLAEAEALFARVMGEPRSMLGQAHLALDHEDPRSALDLAERFLRRIPSEDVTTRAEALELVVRSAVNLGDLEHARTRLGELEQTAKLVGTGPLIASVSLARGLLRAAEGSPETARSDLEDAVDRLIQIGAPFETAIARIELSQVLIHLGRGDLALAEAREALVSLTQLGARTEARRATKIINQIGAVLSENEQSQRLVPGLTRRESDVVMLIARGLSNPQIAERLFISVRTVERHISSIYQKLGIDGPSARAAATAYALEQTSLVRHQSAE